MDWEHIGALAPENWRKMWLDRTFWQASFCSKGNRHQKTLKVRYFQSTPCCQWISTKYMQKITARARILKIVSLPSPRCYPLSFITIWSCTKNLLLPHFLKAKVEDDTYIEVSIGNDWVIKRHIPTNTSRPCKGGSKRNAGGPSDLIDISKALISAKVMVTLSYRWKMINCSIHIRNDKYGQDLLIFKCSMSTIQWRSWSSLKTWHKRSSCCKTFLLVWRSNAKEKFVHFTFLKLRMHFQWVQNLEWRVAYQWILPWRTRNLFRLIRLIVAKEMEW